MTSFQLPEAADKPTYVREMFDRIAVGYDKANNLFTAGFHHLWKQRLLNTVAVAAGDHALDLATGTGDIARSLAERVGAKGRVVGLDFSSGMLNVAKQHGDADGRIEWVQGDMLALPFADASFDVVTVGFGLRNVGDLDQALREIARVLKPGGRFGSLEMGHPRWGVMRFGVWVYNSTVVPLAGKLSTGEAAPYQYLHASSLDFVSQDQLAERSRAAGLEAVRVDDIVNGTLAIVSGRKRA